MRLSLKVFRWGYKSVIWELPLPTENTAAQPYYTEKPKPESKGPSARAGYVVKSSFRGVSGEPSRPPAPPSPAHPAAKPITAG